MAIDSNPPASTATVPPFSITEYLDAEEKAAKAALNQTFTDMKNALTGNKAGGTRSASGSQDELKAGSKAGGALGSAKDAFNKRPILSLIAAAGTGFFAAITAVPSKEQQVLKKLAALERAVALHGHDVVHAKPGGNTLLGTLVNSLASVVKPILLHGVTAALAAQTAGESATEAPPQGVPGSDAGPSYGPAYS